jgi:crotonobetainyl-CoA:carnitine CoA-transferase CaiB-like acyl-CoA transferase
VPALLAGVRVVDLTTVVFGPLATQVLADYGADVVKIEPPEGDIMRHAGVGAADGMGPIFLNLNRGKRSVVLDLKHAEGKALLRELLRGADVFVHNVRRRAIDRLGFSEPAVRAVAPTILYCAATGFAATSDRADAAAIDDVIQASAGLAALNADADGVPRLVQSLVADKIAGLGLACAVLAGLYRRKATGAGVAIDLPMHETLAAFLLLEHLQGATFEPSRGPIGYHRVTGRGRRIYRARDGYVAMTPYSTEQWSAFFRAVGRLDLAADPRITDPVQRNANVADLYDLIGAVTASRTVAEWERLARELGFPAQGVRTLGDVAADPQLARSGTLAERPHAGVGTTRLLASPGFFDGQPARHSGTAPRLGQHTAEVLAQAGVRTDAIERALASGAIRCGD